MANLKICQNDLSVCCSWGVLNDRSIENALTFEIKGVKNQKVDLESIVSLETCIELGNQDVDVPCTFDIKTLTRDTVLMEVSVVSEARIVEVYGECGEYLTTTHAEFIDDWEDMAVYMAEIKLPQPSSECSLKFARLKNKGRMWLYGIHIIVDKEGSSSIPEKTVNFQNVNKILKESSSQLTEKADRCKKFLQMYYAGGRDQSKAQAIPNPQSLLKMFEAEYLSQRHAKNMSKCLADLLPGLSPKGKNEDKVNVPTPQVLNTQDAVVLSQEMKCYIDQRFNELEEKILQRVDDKFYELQRKQNEKLDQILLLVQNLQFSSTNRSICVNHVLTES